ncbi:MAG: AbrB/MazE/SpoVT family DNA-binding domain-containing protein [Candidatus Micrarchaeota archaeon]
MYEHVSIIGERGQITIPKDIREVEGLKEKDRVIIKIEDNKIVIEKITTVQKKKQIELLKEGYKKLGKLSLEITKEFEHADKSANRFLDDY